MVILKSNVFGVIPVAFSLDALTVCSAIILGAGFVGVCSSFAVYIIKIIAKSKRTKLLWILHGIVFSICLFSEPYLTYDFFTTAFNGIG
jgi:hypothetical protein